MDRADRKAERSIASEALARIAELYRIETVIRGQDADARRTTRQEKTKPLLAAFDPSCATSFS